MCPLHENIENVVYKPVKVNSIIALFENQAICNKPKPIIRSKSAAYSRNNSTRKCVAKRRNAKSDVIVQNNNDENPIYENIGSKNKESYKRLQRLNSIPEADLGDVSQYGNINEVRSKAQAVLRKYNDEVLADLDNRAPSQIVDQSIYLIKYENDDCSIADDDSEGIRSRNSSLSIDDEYATLRELHDNPNKFKDSSDDGYSVLHPGSDEGRYVPQYENISAIREMAKLISYRKNNNFVGTSTAEQTISCRNERSEINNSSEPAINDKKKSTVDELIHTEDNYIKDLEFVIKNYMKYISDIYTGCPMRRYKYIFINIEMIRFESENLLKDIKSQEYNYCAIARTFCQYRYLMERYTVYCKNKRKSQELLNGEYSEIIEKRRKEIRDPLGLGSYLLKPIQRLLRYGMLLRRLYKYITREGGQGKCIKEAINLIERTARRGNDLTIISCIQDIPHCISDTGNFIMGDSFKMLIPQKMDIDLFLFENMIVFAVKKGVDSFVYKTYIPVENLTKSCDYHKTTFTLEDYFMKKNHRDPSYMLDAMNMKKKKKWLECIDDILWKQLREIKARAKKSTHS